MCLIAVASKDRSQIPSVNLENAHRRNSDAWGVMYPKGDGTLVLLKDVSDHAAFRKHWLDVPTGRPVAAHFRFATHGAKDLGMAHPFPLLVDENGDVVLAMMHNGVLSGWSDFKERSLSDTYIFLRDVLTPQLVDNPDLVKSNGWRQAMGAIIGNPNKFVFMEGDGSTYIVNDYQGKWEKGGVWYSNTYSIESPVYTKPTTHTPYYGENGSWWKGYMQDKNDDAYGDLGSGVPGDEGVVKEVAGTALKSFVYINGEPKYLTPDELEAHMHKKSVVSVSAGHGEPLDTIDSDPAPRSCIVDVPDESHHAFASMAGLEPSDFAENLYYFSEDQVAEWVEQAHRDEITEAFTWLSVGESIYN